MKALADERQRKSAMYLNIVCLCKNLVVGFNYAYPPLSRRRVLGISVLLKVRKTFP